MDGRQRDVDDSSSFEFPSTSRLNRGAEAQSDSEQGKQRKNNESSSTCSFKSTLLAGHAVESESQSSTDNSYKSAKSNALIPPDSKSLDTLSESCRSLAISIMNKPINLEFGPQSDLDLTSSSQEATTCETLKINLNNLDTNHNVRGGKNSQAFSNINLKPRDILSALSCIDECLETTHDKTDISKNNIMKRLSQGFVQSPSKFTEELVTIIDESESSCLEQHDDNTIFNFCTIPKDFQSGCKFIQDESMPEWAPSLCMNTILGTSTFLGNNKVVESNAHQTILESPKTPPPTHVLSTKKTYRKTPKHVLKNNSQGAGSSLYMNVLERAVGREMKNKSKAISNPTLNDSSFTYWERYCEENGSPPVCSTKLERSSSRRDISHPTKEEIMIVCEKQLRSLDDSDSPVEHGDAEECQEHSEFATFDSHAGHRYRNREIGTPASNIGDQQNEIILETALSSKSNESEENDLTKSLMIEIEKKRQRCFDTIKTLQEIEKEAEETHETFSELTNRRDVDVEQEFLKTIMSCIEYRNFLKQTKQSIDVKRFETLSLDSGIDTRSIAQNRKMNAAPPVEKKTEKQNQKHRISVKSPRSRNTSAARTCTVSKATDNTNKENNRMLGVTSNVRQRTPRKINQPCVTMSARKKTPVSLKVSRTRRSRPRSAEKLVPQRNTFVSPKCLISGGIKATDNDLEPRVPENLTPQELANKDFNLQISNQEICNTGITNTPKMTPQRNMNRIPTNRFFVTPGKSVEANKRKLPKKTYFPGMNNELKSEETDRLMRIQQAPGIYKLGYNAVISPVSTYIHGTDMNLIQNVRAKNNNVLLTPSKCTKNIGASNEKLTFKLSAKTPTPQVDARKRCQSDLNTDRSSNSDINDENELKSEFVRPKSADKPSAPSGIYKRGYNAVISPISIYIHGTDTNLPQNMRVKTKNVLLTPAKGTKNVDASKEKLKSKLFEKPSTAQKYCQFDSNTDSSSRSDTNDENEPKSVFVLPKLTYKPSSQVNTVKENPRYVLSPRIKGLFKSSEERVIIQHEKKKVEERQDNQVPENTCSSTDESIHVVKLAKKSRRK